MQICTNAYIHTHVHTYVYCIYTHSYLHTSKAGVSQNTSRGNDRRTTWNMYSRFNVSSPAKQPESRCSSGFMDTSRKVRFRRPLKTLSTRRVILLLWRRNSVASDGMSTGTCEFNIKSIFRTRPHRTSMSKD